MTCYFGAYCLVRSGMATCECPDTECPAKEGPSVCGSDGRTYLSSCHLRAHACRTQSDIVIQAFGACGDEGPHVRRGSRSAGRLPRSSHRNTENTLDSNTELNSISLVDVAVDTSDSGKPDSPDTELSCIDILPPPGYR